MTKYSTEFSNVHVHMNPLGSCSKACSDSVRPWWEVYVSQDSCDSSAALPPGASLVARIQTIYKVMFHSKVLNSGKACLYKGLGLQFHKLYPQQEPGGRGVSPSRAYESMDPISQWIL